MSLSSSFEVIREAVVGDAPEILRLQKMAFKPEGRIYKDENIPPLVESLADLRKEFKSRHTILKCLVDGRIVGAVRAYKEGDEVSMDIDAGEIIIAGQKFNFPTLPKEILAIRDAGGLLAYTRGKLG